MKDLIREMWEDGWIGRIILIFVVVVLLIAMVAIRSAIVNEMNHLDSGTVVDKKYHQAYTTFVSSGKSMVPVYHPESFAVTLTDGEKTYYATVPESVWEKADIGEFINLEDGL